MPCSHWSLQPKVLFQRCRIIPIVVIHRLSDALPLAHALQVGGIHVMEVTLRTPVALQVIEQLRQVVPDMMIGAGTVITVPQYQQCIDAGAAFAISPGITQSLLEAAQKKSLPLIPGVSSASDVMIGLDFGYTHFKFFPAESSGGIQWLKDIHKPFPDIQFCPTGGINAKNVLDYLALPNVPCVGGSWMISDTAMEQQNWNSMTIRTIEVLREIQSRV